MGGEGLKRQSSCMVLPTPCRLIKTKFLGDRDPGILVIETHPDHYNCSWGWEAPGCGNLQPTTELGFYRVIYKAASCSSLVVPTKRTSSCFFYFYKIQSIVPTVNKGRFLKPYASGENWGPGLAAKSKNLEGWDRCLLAEGKKVGQSFQML